MSPAPINKSTTKKNVDDNEDALTRERGKIRQRRTYTVPPSSDEPTHSGNHDSIPLSKQQKILRQRRAQQMLEDTQHNDIAFYTNSALQELILKYSKTLIIIFLIGIGILLYIAPELLYKWVRVILWKPRQTKRSMAIMYPWPVRQDLPLVYRHFSIATPENLPARRVIEHVANLRNVAVENINKNNYSQTIRLHAWEHEEFERQTHPHMAQYCGPSFEEKYRGAVSQEMKDDMVLWCFMANGHHDGYVKYGVHTLYSPIVRGTKGVAVQRFNSQQKDDIKRIHSESFLLLPVHEYKDITGDSWVWKLISTGFMLSGSSKQKKKLPPSTNVGFGTLKWLNINAGDEFTGSTYRDLLEEFLYQLIVEREGVEKWILLQAACTEIDRLLLFPEQRLVGSTCKEIFDNTDDCCHIFDPHQSAYHGHKRLWQERLSSGDNNTMNLSDIQ